ncbi:MAG: rod shape-determining protein MreD [Clostridiales Family XIII bacterium]|jgi:rod shape-determining protein MreD|nr:rod shape-determining protein MreD [Clostridiales Family XIII bacterium]
MKTMRYYAAVPIFLFAFLLQTTVLWKLPVFGSSPNLLLCLVVIFSFLYEERYGLILGALFGVLLDIATSALIGPQAITFVAVYLIVRVLRNVFNHEKLIPDVLMALIATPVNLFLVWLINRICGVPEHIIFVVKALLPLLLMHMAITALLHPLFARTAIRYRSDSRYEGGRI